MPLDPHDTTLPHDLTGLVGSRLCHDLISPLGAIGNGVELLTMSGQAIGPELQLVAESVASANARLKFFRVAFGAASADQRMGQPEILALLEDAYRGNRLKVSWLPQGDQARHAVKLALLGLLCLEHALSWGGTVAITRSGPGWQLRATARKTRQDPPLWALLDGAGPAPALAPAQVQFALLALEAVRQGCVLGWDVSEDGALISF